MTLILISSLIMLTAEPIGIVTLDKNLEVKSIDSLKQRLKTDSVYDSVSELKYDERHPLYVGDWERSIPGEHENISHDKLDEPHIKRKHVILAAHPEITSLYGIDRSTKYITAALVAVQLSLAYYFGKVNNNGYLMLAVAYVVGACIAQNFGIVIHEATHGLVADSALGNRIAGLLANVALPFPIAMSFRRYHLEHHSYQGKNY